MSGSEGSNSPSIFPIDNRDFSNISEFNHYLSEEYQSICGDDLYIVSAVTEYSTHEFFEALRRHGWEIIQEYGAVTKIRNKYSERNYAECYLTYDESAQVFLFYTNQRKTEEIEDGIEPFLQQALGVHYLYISPRILRRFREDLAEEYNPRVTEFVAKRTERTKTKAEYRPDSRRTFNYYGEDGLDTLREVERDYGVLPHIMQIEVPDKVKFRVDKNGLFNLQGGSLTFLFDRIQECIEASLKIKEAYQNTSFNVVDVSENFQLPTSKPAAITLRNHLEYNEVDEIKSNFNDDDYFLLDSYAQEGSLFLSGTIYDESNNSTFKLRANKDEIRIFPQERHDIGTFYQFVEFVQNSLDERAQIQTVEG